MGQSVQTRMESAENSGLSPWAHGQVLFYYTALSILLTYPLVLNFTTHFPGLGGDGYVFLWNFWYFKHRISQGLNPMFTHMMFHPVGASLFFQSYTLVNDVLALIFFLYTDNIAMVTNSVILVSLILSGYFMFLLARHLTRDVRAALLAGTIFAFCPYKFAHMLGHFELTSTHWIPLFVLFFLKTVDAKGTYRHAVITGIIAALTLADVHYYTVFLILFVGLFYAYKLWDPQRRREYLEARAIKKVLAVAATSLLLAGPYLALSYKNARAGYYDPARGWLGANHFAGDVTAFFVPSFQHPLWKTRVQDYYFKTLSQSTEGNFVESVVFIGWLVTLLALFAGVYLARRRPELRMWRFLGLAFLILSLGPTLHVYGRYQFQFDELTINFPMPYFLMRYIPVISHVRCPGRLSIMFMLCAAVMSAYVWVWIRDNLPRAERNLNSVFAVVILLVLFEYLSVPYPMHPASVPQVFQKIAADKGPGTVLEIPVAVCSSIIGRGNNVYGPFWLYAQTVHQKKRLGGYTGSGIQKVLNYYKRFPVMQHLFDVEEKNPIPPEVMEADSGTVADFIQQTSLKYIVVHPGYKDSPPHQYIARVFNLGDPLYQDEGYLVYQVGETVAEPAPAGEKPE